jgi:putative hydrolase of the HAD superfamily
MEVIDMLVVLDADDTLWPTMALYERLRREFRAVMERVGIIDEDVIHRLKLIERSRIAHRPFRPDRFVESMVITYAILCTERGIPYDPDIDAVLCSFRHLLDSPPEPYPDVESVLSRLRADGHELVMYTAATDLDYQSHRIGVSGIAHHFHRIEIVPGKKDRERFQRLLQSTGRLPSEAISVGNSYQYDICPAIRCGAHAVLIDRGDCPLPNRIHPSVHVLSTLEGLPDIIKEVQR